MDQRCRVQLPGKINRWKHRKVKQLPVRHKHYKACLGYTNKCHSTTNVEWSVQRMRLRRHDANNIHRPPRLRRFVRSFPPNLNPAHDSQTNESSPWANDALLPGLRRGRNTLPAECWRVDASSLTQEVPQRARIDGGLAAARGSQSPDGKKACALSMQRHW